MKLVKSNTNQLVRRLSGDGLFSADIHYKATEAAGEFNYTGPKIPHEVWAQVLSFFRWTYETTKSESQVRLFVNPKLGTWKAWAFPQQAESGLSTKELPTDDAKKQRAELFENHDDWIAWGTVHHHCSINAFQSGTDESDEENVSGLHITIGDMDKPAHSFHARLYHQSEQFEPDMSKFWDIGNDLSLLPAALKNIIPANIEDVLARSQMCQPSDVPFPDQWKANLIKVERAKLPWEGNSQLLGEVHLRGDSPQPHSQPVTYYNYYTRSKTAVREILAQITPFKLSEDEALKEIEEQLHFMAEDDLCGQIIDSLKSYNLDPADLLDEVRRRMETPQPTPDETTPTTSPSENDYCQ